MSDRDKCRLLFGSSNSAYISILRYQPRKFTIMQLMLIYTLLEGKYSLPMLCALAAGYCWSKAPVEWFDGDSLPPLPPELEAQERAEISVKELKALRDSIK